jgi:hypothetical protein
MAASKLTIDLSGIAGLASNFAGDLNDTTSQPQLRYLGAQGELANGIYDPLRVQGYMSPANDTYTSLTGTITNEIIATAYSPQTDTTFFAESGINLASVAGLNGTTITETAVLPGTSSFRDLEIYQVNDQEALFYTYNLYDTSVSNESTIGLGFKTTDPTRGAFQLASLVFESLSTTDQQIESISDTTNFSLGQSFYTSDFFTTGGATVSGIRLRLQVPYVGVTQTWTCKVGIQTDNGSGFPSGTYVTGAVVTVAASTLPVGTFDYVYFTFASPVTLSAKTEYHVVLSSATTLSTPNQGVYWLSTAENNTLYSDGQTEIDNGSTWTKATSTNESFDFALIINTYNNVGSTTGTILVDTGISALGTNTMNAHGTGTTLSGTMTTATTADPCVVVGVMTTSSSDLVTNVTCDGVSMILNLKQQAVDSGAGDNHYQYLYYITGISSGSHTIVVTTSSSTTITLLGSDYYNVNQLAPFIASETFTNNGGSRTTSYTVSIPVPSLPTAAGGIPVFFGHASTANSNPNITLGTGSYSRASSSSDLLSVLGDSNSWKPSGTGTYSFTVGSTDLAYFYVIAGTLVPPTQTSLPIIIPPFFETSSDADVFLHSAQNGLLYLFTNNRVHKYDGGITGTNNVVATNDSSGTQTGGLFTADVLLFPTYIRATDAIDSNNLLYIAIESSDTAIPTETRQFPADTIGVYSWNYQSILSTIQNYYQAPGARSIKRLYLTVEGEIRLITIGADKFTEVRGLINGQFSIMFRLGLNSYPSKRDSISYVNNMATWVGTDGITYMVGKLPIPGAAEGVYKVGTLANQAVGTITPGVIAVGNNYSSGSQDAMLISYVDTTAGNKLVRWYPHGVGTINTVAQKSNAGNVYTLVLMFPTLAKINYVRLFNAPVGATGTTVQGTVTSYLNQSTTAARTDTVTAADIFKGYKYIKWGQSLGISSGVFAIQFQLTWPTTTTASTSTDWMLRAIEVNYEEIEKIL